MRKRLLAAGVASLALTSAAYAVELYNNGSFVTGTNSIGDPISQIPDGYDTFGLVAGGYSATPQRVADDFFIATGGWDLDTLTVYGYQSGGVVDPFTSAYVGIFDFDPTLTANLSPRYGSLDPGSAPNVFMSQTALGIYRVSAANPDDISRHVHSVTLDLGSVPVLAPGQYWFAVGLQGTTSTSVVAVVPVTPVPENSDGLSFGRIRYAVPGRENFWQYADGNIATGEDPNVIQPYDHAFKLDGTQVSINEWAGPGGGVFDGSPTNWTQGQIPGGSGAFAHFGPGAASPATVTFVNPVTLGKINFNNSNSYTLDGNATIMLEGPNGAQINNFAGTHTILTPISVSADLGFWVQLGGQLNIASGIDSPSRVVMRGRGTAVVNSVRSDSMELREGTLRIAPNGTAAATSNVKQLVFGPGIDTRAKLDLTNNALVVDYTPPPSEPDAEPYDSIRARIISAYNNGAWDGNGITSSQANSSTHGIGYSEASALPSVPPIFGTVDGDAVLIRFTRYGDANLDGIVNLADFNRLAANFGTGDEWNEGDFNYDALVNLQDFNRLAGNFGLSASPDGPTPQDWANLASAVPEPAALALIAIGTAGLLRRNRRKVW